jgi:putative membrane protein
MFSQGFLGTTAPFYMDVVTIYFAILPLLLGIGVRFALKQHYQLHFQWQLITFVLTLGMVVVFEIGVRISGGFSAFMSQSNADYNMMLGLMVIHVLVALVSVVLWSALIYGAIKRYRIEKEALGVSHKKVGYWVFAGMSLTSIMGVMIYWFLFIMGH